MKLPALVVIIILTSVNCKPLHIDRGLIQTRNRSHLYVPRFPLNVTVHESITEPAIIAEPIVWWNAQMSRDGKTRRFFTSNPDGHSDVLVKYGILPAVREDPTQVYLDLTYVERISNGRITKSVVVLNVFYQEDRTTIIEVIKHSLGHTVGLRNDSKISARSWLNSIMLSPLEMNGVVTKHDFILLRQMYDSSVHK